MKVRIDRENVEPNVTGLVLVSHGLLSQGMLDTLEMIAGPQINACALSFQAGDVESEFHAALKEAIALYPAGCIVFLDIMGGSPANALQLLALQQDAPIYAIAGMNLPLVIEAAMDRLGTTAEEVYGDVLAVAEESVVGVTERIAQAKADMAARAAAQADDDDDDDDDEDED